MGSVVESASTPLAGFNLGFGICSLVMLAGGAIGIALMHLEREVERLAGRDLLQYRRAMISRVLFAIRDSILRSPPFSL